MSIENLKKHKVPRVDHIPSKLIQASGGKLYEQINKPIVLIWNKEGLPQAWKDAIIVPIHKKGCRMDCNNYRDFPLLPTSYKILSNIVYSKMTPYANDIIGEYQCGYERNRSTVDHIFSIR